MRNTRKFTLFSAASFVSLACFCPAKAQQAAQGAAAPAQLQEIVVTAQRSEQNLQRVPVPIDAVSGEALARAQVTNPSNLTKLVPSVQISPAASAYTVFFIRGIGSNAVVSLADPAVAFAYNDVFISRPFATSGQFFDLQRIEVVRGPQGTLYGRNATAGAINLLPNMPKFHFGGDVGLTYGNYNTIIANGAVNLPVAENTALRLSFQSARHDGYVSDGTGDEDSQSVRALLLTKPTDSLSVLLDADYAHIGGRGSGAVLISGGFAPEQRVGLTDPRAQAYLTSVGFQPIDANSLHNNNRLYGFSAKVDWTTPLGTLTVIPAYRHASIDAASTQPLYEVDHEDENQVSLETRLASNIGSRLKSIVGLYALNDPNKTNFLIDQLSNAAGAGNTQIYDNATRSIAAFADATFSVTDEIRLLGGIRYTEDRKSVSGVFTGFSDPSHTPTGTIVLDARKKFSATTWRAGAEWDVAPHSLLYATVSTGYHSGGFFFTHDNPLYQPEKLTAYTLGSKNRFLGGRIQVNLEIYDWEYRNQQISHITQDSTRVTIFATENAGKSYSRGADVEIDYQATADTLVAAQVQYLDAKLVSFTYKVPFPANAAILCQRTVTAPFTVNCAGMRPPQAPEWTINGSLRQTFHLGNSATLVGEASVHYQTSTITAVNYLPNDVQPAYAAADLSLTYSPDDRGWSLTGFANNVTNTTIVAYTQHLANLLATGAALRPPRTYGVRLDAHF